MLEDVEEFSLVEEDEGLVAAAESEELEEVSPEALEELVDAVEDPELAESVE